MQVKELSAAEKFEVQSRGKLICQEGNSIVS